MENIVEIPEKVNVKIEDSFVTVSGELGEVKREFSDPFIDMKVKENEFVFHSKKEVRKTKRVMNSFVSELKNMIKGVTEGFTYKMKVIFTHFPMTVKVENEKVRIDNFIGERSPRFAKIFPGVEINIQKQDIELKGIDRYAVSQSAANIEQACKVGNRDRRVFQDGIYITFKGE